MAGLKRDLTLLACAALIFVTISRCQKTSFGLPDTGSLQYADPACRIELSGSEMLLAESLRSGKLTVQLDECLSAAARAIAAKIAHEQKDLSSDEIRKILLSYGIADSQMGLRTYVAPWAKTIAKSVSKDLTAELVHEDYTHFGVGTFRKIYPPRVYAAFVITKKMVFLDPFPKKVPKPIDLTLSGRIEQNYKNAQLLFSNPEGATTTTDVITDSSNEFAIWLPFDAKKPGTYVVEIEVAGARGPEVGALFTVDYLTSGYHPNAEIEAKSSGTLQDSIEKSRSLLLAWINEERKKRGLHLLAEDAQLTALAQSRAERMLAEGRPRHIDAKGLDAADEAESMGIKFAWLGENLAFNSDLFEAHKNLMETPSHRENILNPMCTRIGLGIAIREKKESRLYVVTEIFVAD